MPHVVVYLDDILISTLDLALHLVVLRQVFVILDANGLTINFGKCDFLQEGITFLGHGVSTASVTPLGGHIDAIRTGQVSFLAIKDALVAAVPLAHPLPYTELLLATNASDNHIEGVLQQQEINGWWPLCFFSKKLSTTERKYSAFDR